MEFLMKLGFSVFDIPHHYYFQHTGLSATTDSHRKQHFLKGQDLIF